MTNKFKSGTVVLAVLLTVTLVTILFRNHRIRNEVVSEAIIDDLQMGFRLIDTLSGYMLIVRDIRHPGVACDTLYWPEPSKDWGVIKPVFWAYIKDTSDWVIEPQHQGLRTIKHMGNHLKVRSLDNPSHFDANGVHDLLGFEAADYFYGDIEATDGKELSFDSMLFFSQKTLQYKKSPTSFLSQPIKVNRRDGKADGWIEHKNNILRRRQEIKKSSDGRFVYILDKSTYPFMLKVLDNDYAKVDTVWTYAVQAEQFFFKPRSDTIYILSDYRYFFNAPTTNIQYIPYEQFYSQYDTGNIRQTRPDIIQSMGHIEPIEGYDYLSVY